MRIGELARHAEVNIQTLRFYEREGLLPAPLRSGSGYRIYEISDLERVRFIATSWITRSVLVRARRMRPADSPTSVLRAMSTGQDIRAVVYVNSVADGKLSGTLLQRENDTVYRQPAADSGSELEAALTTKTVVVMGRPQDIVPGAVVQVAGILDHSHILHTNQIVILTGYLRVEQKRGERGE